GELTRCTRCGAELRIPETDTDKPPTITEEIVEMTEVPEDVAKPKRRRKRQAPGRRPLWPWIAAAGLLVAAVGEPAVWFFFLRAGAPSSAVAARKEPVTDLAWVPSQSLFIVTARVDKWWTSESGRKAQQPLAAFNPVAQVEKVLGVSPADIKRISLV